jgi:vancomycin permeability regulator SanA
MAILSRRVVRNVLLSAAVVTVISAVPRVGFALTTNSAVVAVADAPKRDVALVLGAGLRADGKPTDVLQARIDTAVSLYAAGKVHKLLMSGDNSNALYDEVTAMKAAAVANGVPENDVLLDYAGFRTLDSCVRVRKVFGQRQVLVVSQGFHLPRAIHLCRWAGVDAIGVEASDPRGTTFRMRSGVREIPASFQAWIDAHVLGRSAKFLGPTVDINDPPPEVLHQPDAGQPAVQVP